MKPENNNQHAEGKVFHVLYAIFFLTLPLVYSTEIIDPVLIPRQMALTIFTGILVCILVFKAINNKIKLPFSLMKLPVPLLMVTFIVLVALSLFRCLVLEDGLYVLSKNLVLFLFFLSTVFLIVSNQLRLSPFIKIIAGFVAITLLVFAYQLITGDGQIASMSSTMANKNLLASALFLTWPFLVSSMRLTKVWRSICFGLLLISFAVIWFIQTKAVIVAAVLFIGVLLLILFLKRRELNLSRRMIKRSLFVFVSCCTIVISLSIVNKEHLPHLFNTNTAQTRLLLWNSTGQIISENTVTGVGAGNWRVHFPDHGLQGYNEQVRNGLSVYQRPHNDFLWVFSELGIGGFVVYVLLFAFVIFSLFKLVKTSDQREEILPFAALLAAVVGYAFIAAVDFPFERIEHQVLIVSIFAFATAAYANKFKPSESVVKPGISTVLGVMISASILIFSYSVSANRYDGEKHTAKMKEARLKQNWKRVISEARLAQNTFYSVDPMSMPLEWYIGVAQFSMDDIKRATVSFQKALVLTPTNIHVLNNVASCFEKEGAHEDAEKYYLKALEISPGFEESLLNLCAVYFNKKEKGKAFDMIDKMDPNSENQKYHSFLPVILGAKIDLMIHNPENSHCIDQLNAVKNSAEKTLELYQNSKQNSSSFEFQLLNYCNEQTTE
jgi:O-antigen ligase